MATEVAPVTVSHAGMEVTSNSETEDQVREAVGAPSVDEETSEAASKLGKKGAAAAAEARKAKPKAEPKVDETEEPAETKPEKVEKKAEAKDEKPDKPPTRVQKLQGEIARLVAERRTEEERVTKLRKERETLERPPEPQKAAKPQTDDPEPSHEDAAKYPEGRFDPKYLSDRVDWGVRQGVKAERARLQQEAAETEKARAHEARAKTFEERMTKALDDDAFAERIQAIPDDPVRSKILTDLMRATPFDLVPPGEAKGPLNLIAHWLLTSPLAPEVTLYLAEHPEDYAKMIRESPDGLQRSLARVEAKLEQPQERPIPVTAGAEEKAQTYVPPKPPLRPVKATASSANGPDQAELSKITELDKYAVASGARGLRRR